VGHTVIARWAALAAGRPSAFVARVSRSGRSGTGLKDNGSDRRGKPSSAGGAQGGAGHRRSGHLGVLHAEVGAG